MEPCRLSRHVARSFIKGIRRMLQPAVYVRALSLLTRTSRSSRRGPARGPARRIMSAVGTISTEISNARSGSGSRGLPV